MKRIKLLFSTVFTTCLLQACHGDNSSLLSDDTTIAVADTSGSASIIVGADDAQFVKLVGAGCLAEIKIGALAKKRGKDKRIKNFGAMMVKDLTKGHGRLALLAQSKKITLPDSVNAEDQASIDSLAAKSGREFDMAYLDKTTADYKKALGMFENTSKRAFDPQIKQFAAKNILTIQRHLDLIEAVRGSMR
jgi:putative membrane protein